MNQASQPKKYFDLHLTGLGYLSRVREVTSAGHGRAKAKPFLACSISAFHGDPEVQNGVVYLNLDLIVSGETAKDVILSVMDDANDRDVKVLVGFRAGDHYISTYEIKQGNRAGQMGTVLKGCLLKVFWVKVDGVSVYQAEDREDQSNGQADTPEDVLFSEQPHPSDAPISGDEPFDGTADEVQVPDQPVSQASARETSPAQTLVRQEDGDHSQRPEASRSGTHRASGFARRAPRRTGTEA